MTMEAESNIRQLHVQEDSRPRPLYKFTHSIVHIVSAIIFIRSCLEWGPALSLPEGKVQGC
jgi:hypothetical protein